MRGDDLLLSHLQALPGVDDELEDADPRPSARERLEAELGPDLADQLVRAVGRTPPAA